VNILAFDTAAAACSAALWRDGRLAAHRFEPMERGHAEALIPMVTATLAEAGKTLAGLGLLAVTVGPGAFTGLRIGLAAAKGFSLASGIPTLGVTTLEAVAHAVPEEELKNARLLVVLETKRADFYAQAFDADLKPLTAPEAVRLEAFPAFLRPHTGGRLLIAGDAAMRALATLGPAGAQLERVGGTGLPDARYVAAIAAARFRPGMVLSPLTPLYLRPPEARLPEAGGRLRP
jgi:tRNA threonylcarbamoyladenosine biosynthesis protein TsaB